MAATVPFHAESPSIGVASKNKHFASSITFLRLGIAHAYGAASEIRVPVKNMQINL